MAIIFSGRILFVPLNLWYVYAIAGAIGGLCALVALRHMRSNPAVESDAPQATRPSP